MTRTAPKLRPNGDEKSSAQLTIRCTETEKFLWRAVLGNRLAEEVRTALNSKAARKAKLKK